MTATPPGRVAQPWELLAERERTGGWLPVATRSYRMPDGSTSDWDIHVPGFTTVGVLALTPDGDLVLARQFRPGPGEVLLDLPGGIVDAGETVAQAAARELTEETGYSCATVDVVASCWAFAASTWRRHVAVARECRPTEQVTSWGGDEYCEPVVMSVQDFREVLRRGQTTDIDLGYLALDAAGLL